MSDNTFDPKHPHEPEIPPHFDADGRCLICVMICKRDRAIRERDEAIKQIHEEARDYELQIKKLCEAYNDLGEQNAKLRDIADALAVALERLDALYRSEQDPEASMPRPDWLRRPLQMLDAELDQLKEEGAKARTFENEL